MKAFEINPFALTPDHLGNRFEFRGDECRLLGYEVTYAVDRESLVCRILLEHLTHGDVNWFIATHEWIRPL